MVPAIAIALLVVGGAMALVFDRLWQDAAYLELRTAGEAAALAAAHRLADDDSLRKDADWEAICQAARTTASQIAAKNMVGGMPVRLWDDEDGEIELGRIVPDNAGEPVFVRTTDQPDCVSVQVEQGRGASNPVGLLVRDLTGAGRLLRTIVEARADHRVAGLRPYAGVNAPILPIALSAIGPNGWTAMTTAGPDTAGVPRGTATVAQESDGISEMTAWSAPLAASPREQLLATVHVFDIGAGLSGERLAEQCRDGWSVDDLEKFDGELRTDGKPLTLPSTPKIPAEVVSALGPLVGQTRLCLVYDAVLPGTSTDEWTVVCRKLVGIRILGVQPGPDGMLILQVQPAVIVTRTAITLEDDAVWNPLVCKVSLIN
jgi:hypothetical protein